MIHTILIIATRKFKNVEKNFLSSEFSLPKKPSTSRSKNIYAINSPALLAPASSETCSVFLEYLTSTQPLRVELSVTPVPSGPSLWLIVSRPPAVHRRSTGHLLHPDCSLRFSRAFQARISPWTSPLSRPGVRSCLLQGWLWPSLTELYSAQKKQDTLRMQHPKAKGST